MAPSVTSGAPTRPSSGSPAVLIVDDDEAMRKLIARRLESSGFRCVEASSGQDAIDAVAAAPEACRAIVLDVMMPGLDGFETLAAIKKLPGAELVPVVFLTASSKEGDVVRGVEAGAVDYLVKPFSGPILVAKLRAVCERADAARELRDKLRFAEENAATDGLTGLLNRRAFDERLAAATASAGRHREPLALVMMDLDLFKSINDEFGHPVGDMVLSHVAHIIRYVLRRGDAAFRYGGEEFAVLLQKCDLLGAVGVSDRMRGELAATPVELAPGKTRAITFSAGIATMEESNDFRAAGLVQRADAALYKAKHGGRDRTELEDGAAL